jgi:hypothetical protein
MGAGMGFPRPMGAPVGPMGGMNGMQGHAMGMGMSMGMGMGAATQMSAGMMNQGMMSHMQPQPAMGGQTGMGMRNAMSVPMGAPMGMGMGSGMGAGPRGPAPFGMPQQQQHPSGLNNFGAFM